MSTIIEVHGREIIDSRGNPTVEAEVVLSSGAQGRAAVPVDEVRRCLTAIFAKQPESDRAHAVAAQLFRRLNDERRALSHYVRAYKSNPRNTEAIRELRLAVMRRRESSAEDGEMLAGIARLLGLRG